MKKYVNHRLERTKAAQAWHSRGASRHGNGVLPGARPPFGDKWGQALIY